MKNVKLCIVAQVTFTWCPSHCGVIGNEMADTKAKDGASLPQTDVDCHYDSTKAEIRRRTRGAAIQHERIRRIYGERGEKIHRKAEKELSRKEQVTLSRLRSGHHPELKYWQKKIDRASDDICRKCGMDSETAEHVIYDCPRIHRNPYGIPPSDTLAKDPRLALIIWENWTSTPDLPDVSKPAPPPSH